MSGISEWPIGQDSIDLLYALHQEVRELRMVCIVIEEFFCKIADTPELSETSGENSVIKISPFLIGFVQSTLLRDLMLRICMLTDPAEQGRYKNLSFFQVLDHFQGLEVLSDDVAETIIERLQREDIQTLRIHRNKRLSHRDYDVALGNEWLPDINWQNIRKITTDFFEIVDQISLATLQTEIMYDDRHQLSFEAKYLIDLLKNGLSHTNKGVHEKSE